MFRMKQDKITTEDLSKTDISNMSHREFKVMIIKVLQRRVEDISETLDKEIKKEHIRDKALIM